MTGDAKGRVTLGGPAIGRTFTVATDDEGRFVLTPVVLVPEREAWLWANPAAIKSVRAGLADALEGRVTSLGSFATHAAIKTGDR